ncbi:hypothetical protein RB195_021008 [Necator americanus]|uniref:ZP domain-containing protein n=1 Tax=Necator americanus TaxID=51031 RepID=A0ABR1CPD3_NECAM
MTKCGTGSTVIATQKVSAALTKAMNPSRFDNSVVGTPVISCERDRIHVEIATARPFAGKIFVKGEYSNSNCVRSYINGVPAAREGRQNQQVNGSPLKSGDKTFESSVENAESKDTETHLDSSVWETNDEGKVQDTPHVFAPEQARRFTNVGGTLESNKMELAEVDFENTKSSGHLTNSKWSRRGGVNPTVSRPGNQYIDAFSRPYSKTSTNSEQSILPSAFPNLKIYSPKPTVDEEDLLSLHYPGPQGFVGGNCPIKCEPCACASEKQPLERTRRNINNVELTVPLGACNAKRDRKLSPPSLVVSFVAVISFHESFITKLDRAYHIQCAYTESNKSISTHLDVGMAAPTDLNTTASPPVCGYHISSAEGKTIQNVRVGDRVKHEWTCRTAVPALYSMMVHSCFVEDGAGQRYEVIDEFGSSVDFQCAIKVCSKIDLNCTAVTPPDCSLKEVPQRRRRDVTTAGESMTLHANSLTVLDADVAEEIPQLLGSETTLPYEFCFSVAGFAILISASTFLTTAALGVAGANLYMRSQSKWGLKEKRLKSSTPRICGKEPRAKTEMSFTVLRDQIEQSDNIFLKMPHIFKPLQTLNAIILAICVGSTSGTENGVLWFIIITSLLISASATVIFALGLQDSIMDSLTNGSIAWNLVELIYSFVFAVLSVVSVWLSFGFANGHLGGTSAGYIATGLFSIIHAGLYSVPCGIIYDSMQTNGVRQDTGFDVLPAHPFHNAPYQDL